jgi:hypothetical protein
MTIKELDKKLEQIKKQLNKVETDLIKEKIRKVSRKKQNRNMESLKDELVSWKNLQNQISLKWDNKLSAVEEIRAQRDKEY